jgi:transcriptional regulator with XRE-family HTH domain
MTDVTNERKTLAYTLWRYRMEAGLSQDELANKAGVSQGAIAMIERGRRTRPYPSTLKKLAIALEVQIKDLLPSVALFCAAGMHTQVRRVLTVAAAYIGVFS